MAAAIQQLAKGDHVQGECFGKIEVRGYGMAIEGLAGADYHLSDDEDAVGEDPYKPAGPNLVPYDIEAPPPPPSAESCQVVIVRTG